MEDEEDYLSEKFLANLEASSKASSTSKIYAERRKEAKRQAEIRNLAGRTKSRKELEKETLETLKEGMGTSLFEREKLAAAEGAGQSKAMKMMSKMGYKPGEALGRREETSEAANATDSQNKPKPAQRVAPIAINIWEGKKGLGAMKRPLSPDSIRSELERAAKAARQNEDATKDTYRSKAREEYEEKRDEGRLISAQKTCITLDEKAGVSQFNVLTLNPRLPRLIPESLRNQLDINEDDDIDDTFRSKTRKRLRQDNLERLDDGDDEDPSSLANRLRREMQRDALTSSHQQEDALLDDDGPTQMKVPIKGGQGNAMVDEEFSEKTIQEAREFLQLPVQERFQKVLHYLRENYSFCFWCGVEYTDKADMDASCPGETEEVHD